MAFGPRCRLIRGRSFFLLTIKRGIRKLVPLLFSQNTMLALGIALLVLSIAPSWVFCALAPSLLAHTTSGVFKGITVDGNLDRWLGIPYAQPPVGDLRFKAPVPITKSHFSGVQNASTFGNACPQLPSDSLGAPQSEDCLFLNVGLINLHVLLRR